MRITTTPREAATSVEDCVVSPGGHRERFFGYGVMGLPFESGHILGLRRFPASSIGPGYTSIWHRAPDRRWSFWSTTSPELGCARYTGEMSDDTRNTAIQLEWTDPFRLTITCEDPELSWDVTFASTVTTRVLGAVARRLPDALLGHETMLRALGPVAGALLGTGTLALTGTMPNRQAFHLVPSHVWVVTHSHARLVGVDLGKPGALPVPARIGDFRIPQRGLLAVGALDFDTLDPATHSTRTERDQSR